MTDPSASSPQDIATRSAAAMWTSDRASQDLGMTLDEVRPGYARLSMTITEAMTNGHAIAHGGFIFTLADSAFAFACNSYGPTTVAAHCDISFLIAAHAGDVLTAEAVERARYGRNGIYDVTVSRASSDGPEVVAEFRGKSRTIG